MEARLGLLVVAALVLPAGCRGGPKSFLDLNDPTPINRARAAGLDDPVPDALAVPELIRRLDDQDPVVRLSAHESLRARTRRDFGFVPWAEPHERAAAVARWNEWWAGRPGASPSPQR